MTQLKKLSNDQINDVFEILGLGTEESLKYSSYTAYPSVIPAREIISPKLSDNSVPLPSGSIIDANMEKFSR